MFVLRFKDGTTKRLFSEEAKDWVETDISGRYLRYIPTRATGYTTSDIQEAMTFTSEQAAKECWDFANCEPVEIVITLKDAA
jgi:hypothetical protein